jgi:hypothetical protein
VAEGLGHQPEAAFASACAAATGGNPLLLRALVREATDRGLRGTAAEAGRATALGSAGIAPAVQRRLRLLGPDATALAGAAAVLGATPRLDDLAAVAGLALEDGRRAADRLVAAELLEAESWSFVHPLVREAVAERLPASERTRLHALAARRLRERGARVDEIAVHLMACDPAGTPRWWRRCARRRGPRPPRERPRPRWPTWSGPLPSRRRPRTAPASCSTSGSSSSG